MFRSVGFDFSEANLSAIAGSGRTFWAQYFPAMWALVHPNQPILMNAGSSITIVSSPCEPSLIFSRWDWAGYLVLCIEQLCYSNGWLNPDISGIGVSE